MVLACKRSACERRLILKSNNTALMLLGFCVFTFAVDKCRHVRSPWYFSCVILSNVPHWLALGVTSAMMGFLAASSSRTGFFYSERRKKKVGSFQQLPCSKIRAFLAHKHHSGPVL